MCIILHPLHNSIIYYQQIVPILEAFSSPFGGLQTSGKTVGQFVTDGEFERQSLHNEFMGVRKMCLKKYMVNLDLNTFSKRIV